MEPAIDTQMIKLGEKSPSGGPGFKLPKKIMELPGGHAALLILLIVFVSSHMNFYTKPQ